MPTRQVFPSARPVFCSPLTRRGFLSIGALGLGGLTLPGLLRAEAASQVHSSHKSVILIYLVGGPPHQDMFDLKPGAPKEVAGPWKPTATNVTGVQICEALPRLARIMDKLVVVRSLVGNQADHDAIQVYNGRNPRMLTPANGWPQLGSAGRPVLRAARRSIQASRPSSACATSARTAPTTSRGLGSSGRRWPRFAPWDRRGTTCFSAASPSSASRIAKRCSETSTPCAAMPTPRARSRRWTRSPNRRSGCSRPPAWPMPSTCRRSRCASSSATEPGTPRCSWTATVLRGCPKAC